MMEPMIASVEIVTCLAVIAGSFKFAAAELTRARRDRQMQSALRRALGDSPAEA